MKRLHATAFALIWMTLVFYVHAGVCSISPYTSNLVNSPTDFGLYFAPTTISGTVPNKITFVIPAYFGIKWAASTACTRDGGSPGQFIGDIPLCAVAVDTAGVVTITVTNLGGTTQTSYRIFLPGFTMGTAEKSNNINEAIDQTVGINCYSYAAGGAGIEVVTMSAGQFPQLAQTNSCGVTLTSSPSMNSQKATFNINIILTQPIPATGSIVLRLPKNNVDYIGLGPISPVSYIQDGSLTSTGTVTTAGATSVLGPITTTIVTNNPFDTVTIGLGNTAVIPSASVLNIAIQKLLLTGSLKTQNNFEVSTADRYGINGYVQKCTTVSITNQYPGDDTVAPFPSSCENTGQRGVLEGNNVYKFNVFTISAIPSGGFFTLQIPTGLGLPSDPTQMTFICLLGCKNLGTKSWSATSRTLTFNSVYPAVNDYLYGQSQISFTLGPFTNAATSVQQFFIWRSYASLGTSQVLIDEIKTMSVTAEQGLCKITKFFPTDNNLYVYGVAVSWTFTLSCAHDINTDYGMILTFPALFTIRDTARCTVGLQNTSYICQASSVDRTIIISRFTNTVIQASTQFSFSVDSIVNPPWTSMTDPVNIAINSGTQGAIDLGSFSLPPDYFIRGYVKKFTVVPEDFGVGSFPVKYRFTIQPTGEVWKLSYFEITIPDEIEIADERDLERKCDYNVQGFQWISAQINCKVYDNKITINSGFRFQNTTNMTDNNYALVPPVFSFTLPAFRNPRTMQPTGAFGLTIFDQFGKPEYTWNQKNWTYSYTNNGQPFQNSTGMFSGPVIQMSKPATAKAVLLMPGSLVNGNLTYYEFLVTTTNYLQEGDNILITLPETMFFSENSTCIGRSTNLRVEQVCKPSVDLSTMNMTLKLPVPKFRMLQAVSTKKIEPLQSFQFRITQIKNPVSTQPTSSLGYYVYTTNGTLFEMMSAKLNVTMTTPGTLNALTSSILPNDFRQSYAANYTLTFSPLNFQQNMKVVVTLPPQILFGSNKVKCWGAAGTDAVSLNCTTDTERKTITINDAFAYQVGNPGTVKFIFQTLKNPIVNKVTDSFRVQTFTPTGYQLDQISKGLEVNFFCNYPCATCNLLRPDQCYSCYGGNSPFSYFFDYKCFDLCPVGYVNTTTNNCTACLSPCTSCVGTPTNCTNCTKDFQLLDEGVCRELVYWPFPFFASGFIFFIIILAAEIKTKTESRFKEAFIAFLALPEIGSWATLVAFLYLRIGLGVATYLAALALLIYIIINLVHACIHPRQIVPNSLFSYKQLAVEHKCNTWTVYLISYIFSFKFSLLLVSYFWLRPSYKGDYSAVNWMQFNKIGLSFICIPYPIMMAACCYFLVTDGMFSYPGFICIEVIVLSSVMTVLMLLDAVSVLKCRVVGKDKTNNQIKVASGLDYESDDDNNMKKVLKRRNYKEGEDFGADEIRSDEASQTGLIRYRTPGFQDSRQESRSHTSQVDEETRKQIAMLEELARQMREEKEYLRLEKERIERERLRMLSDKDEQLQKMHSYMNDFSITEAKQPREEPKIKSTRKNYKDIEGEMEDYEQIEEEEEASEIEVATETVQLPLPSFGQINYIRHGDGDDHFYLQQLSPRQGHQSFVGTQSGFTNEIHMNRSIGAHFDEGVMRKTVRHQEDYVFRDDASYSHIVSTIKEADEIYQQRSNAEMDQHSNRTPMASAQQFFQNEQAVFSNVDNQSEPNDHQDFIYREQAVFGKIDDIKSKQGSERQYFVPEEPAKGQGTGRRTQAEGEAEQFVNRDQVVFDQILTPNNRQGTPQQYFNREKPSLGEVTDRNRSHHDTQQAYINQERAAHGDIDPMNDDEDGYEIRHFNQEDAFREVASDHSRVRMGTHQSLMNQQEPAFARDTEERFRVGTQEKQFNATQAQFERESLIRSRLDSRGQVAVMQASAEFGKTDGFNHSRGHSQHFINKTDAYHSREESFQMREGGQKNFMPEPIDRQDLSGKSESSEGIVDHNPFNSVKDKGKQLVAQTKSPVKKEVNKNLDMPTAQVIPNKKKKTIIYSDKSESSVEEMMGDTPSNYNIPNGRLDGKSLGLKAILLQAQKHGGATIDYNGSTNQMAAPKNQTKSPQAVSNQQNMLSKPKNLTEAEERKFVSKISKGAIDKSVDGGWGSINQPIGANRAEVIGEEQSENEYTSGPAQTKRKKTVKTNKTFAEERLPRAGAKNVTPPPHNANQNLANVRKNNFV